MHEKFIFNFLLTDVINMKTYCLKCKTNTSNINPKMVKTKNNRSLMQSKFSVCGTKKSRFVKNKMLKVY